MFISVDEAFDSAAVLGSFESATLRLEPAFFPLLRFPYANGGFSAVLSMLSGAFPSGFS